MAFFCPGDVVTVRSDLDTHKRYAMDDDRLSDLAVNEMLSLRGCRVTIRDCTYKYSIYEMGWWNWTDEMFQEYLDYKNGIGDNGGIQAITMDDLMSLLGCGVSK